MRFVLFSLLAFSLLSCGNDPTLPAEKQAPQALPAKPANDSLRKELTAIVAGNKAIVGLAIMSLEDGGDTLSINGDRAFALLSVAKFPQVLLLLRMVDEGKYDATQPIALSAEDLKVQTGSTLRKDHPQAAFSLSLKETLRYCIGQSDNITSNKIFELEGGPGAVETYVRSVGIADMGFATDYAHLRHDSLKKNWGTPKAMLALLQKFHGRELLSDSSHALLWTAMTEATSGPDRLKAGLPEGTVLGHKTGTAGTDVKTGITAAVNDVGIVRLPDGRHYGIVVFLEDARGNAEENAGLIAAISRAVWGHFGAPVVEAR